MYRDSTILITNLIQIFICGYTPSGTDVALKAPTKRPCNHPNAAPKIVFQFGS